jgi:maltooligosyltrehalose trehalohydrolase
MASDADRLLIVNLGRDLVLDSAPEPLLAPPENMKWRIFWSSEDPRYGGSGTAAFDNDKPRIVPAHSAVVIMPCQR